MNRFQQLKIFLNDSACAYGKRSYPNVVSLSNMAYFDFSMANFLFQAGRFTNESEMCSQTVLLTAKLKKKSIILCFIDAFFVQPEKASAHSKLSMDTSMKLKCVSGWKIFSVPLENFNHRANAKCDY